MIISETEAEKFKNPDLSSVVKKDTRLKHLLVDYVGRQYQSELARAKVESEKEIEWDGGVTVEMIVEAMSEEFPEFIMAIAEENFIRGYRQGLTDMEQIDAEQSG